MRLQIILINEDNPISANFPTFALYQQNYHRQVMAKVFTHFSSDGDSRRDELIRTIEHSVEHLTLAELEALYYDLVSKDYIR